MVSTPVNIGRRGVRRMLIATIALTLLYIALQELSVAVSSAIQSRGWLATTFQGGLEQEARRLAQQSAAREAQLAPEHRLAAWALGLRLGAAAHFLGTFVRADAARKQQARAAVAPRLRSAQELADFLGIGPVYPLESSTLAQASNLSARIEADEGGIGGRIAERTTPRHQHLYMLGMHVGTTLAALQGNVGVVVPSAQIGRHATLAGLKREDWEPLARVPSGSTPAEAAARYAAAVSGLQQKIAASAGRPQ
jgi:hypothetical protein